MTGVKNSRETNADQRDLDDTIEDSFPASDPPSHTGITGAGHHHAKPQGETGGNASGSQDAKPTGQPTSERHRTETAHQHEGAPAGRS